MAGILGIALLPVGSLLSLGVVWLVLIGASWIAGFGPLRLSRGAFIAAPFLLAAVPVVFVPTPDPLLSLQLGPLHLTVSGPGLTLFATIACKSWLSVQAALLLTFTTPFHDLIDALRDLRLPRIMVAIIGFMYRYLAVIGDEAGRLIRARAARSAAVEGNRAGGGILWRSRVAGGMVGSLFLRSYERSERVYAAMQARGFEGTFVHLRPRQIGVAAWVGLLLLLVSGAAFVVASHLWLPRV